MDSLHEGFDCVTGESVSLPGQKRLHLFHLVGAYTDVDGDVHDDGSTRGEGHSPACWCRPLARESGAMLVLDGTYEWRELTMKDRLDDVGELVEGLEAQLVKEESA